MKYLDPKIWGPNYWFFLHTITLSYPVFPNSNTKKKFYDFITNLHLFIPIESIGSNFSKLLNEYPIAPYLDSRESLIKWMHFIHNKINESLEKPKISLNEFYIKYYENYKPIDVKIKEFNKLKQKLIYLTIICFFIGLIYYLHFM